jgi:mannose-6-phosphate isomerase-like protein (cupin superfamily)
MHLSNCIPVLPLLMIFVASVFHSDDLLAHGTEAAGSKPVTSVSGETYSPVSHGTRKIALDSVTIRMLIDESNIGRNDVEIGELILPVGSPDSVIHTHDSLEIFYVVEGTLGHEVNGESYTLHPGDVGFLKPGDRIVHRVLSENAVKALVIWLPGGESEALLKRAGFKEVPLD